MSVFSAALQSVLTPVLDKSESDDVRRNFLNRLATLGLCGYAILATDLTRNTLPVYPTRIPDPL